MTPGKLIKYYHLIKPKCFNNLIGKSVDMGGCFDYNSAHKHKRCEDIKSGHHLFQRVCGRCEQIQASGAVSYRSGIPEKYGIFAVT